ncbi:hypothetical protein D049_1717A, partial [Vibrio parahaemolyticus VPTS-2010]
MLISGN